MPYETRWTGDRSLFTRVVYGDGSAHEGQDADLCVAGWGLVANADTGQPVTVSGTLPSLIQDVDGAEVFGLFMFLRIAHAPAQYVTDSSFVEQGANQRGRKAPRPQRLVRDRCQERPGRHPLGAQGEGAHHS